MRRNYYGSVHIKAVGEISYWRGPSPFHFLQIEGEDAEHIKEISQTVTYGWGMVPCQVKIGATVFETALWPRQERYFLPLKSAVRQAEALEVGDTIEAHLTIG